MRDSFVIAEIGINHDGDSETAKKLILGALEGECQAIKFQYRNLDRTYAVESEIGDEIIASEIKRNYISPSQIIELAHFAKSLEMQVGISFFTCEDVHDFNGNLGVFDFFKVPSPELTNISLIKDLLKFEKIVLISTGMHEESEIEKTFEPLEKYSNWIPMHCVSNYPVAPHNAKLGYIKYLSAKWGRKVGYSSHDEYWENMLVAREFGATYFERHITLDRNSPGLDHSTSSTPSDFLRFNKLLDYYDLIKSGNESRKINQGERLNRQNLGRSFYAKKLLEERTEIRTEDFEYRSPAIGVDFVEFASLIGAPLQKSIKPGQPLTVDHLSRKSHNLDFSTKSGLELIENKISLPVRIDDFAEIKSLFDTKFYEFHLSYGEVQRESINLTLEKDDSFSVHLPDYISPTELIDPFSFNEKTRKLSRHTIEAVADFSQQIYGQTGRIVPIVCSLSSRNLRKREFYEGVSELFRDLDREGLEFTLQWLPPFAWYFGGSIELRQVNELEDVNFIKEFQIPITMDLSHLLLGQNFFGFNPIEVVDELGELIKHVHLASASGIDGEGESISNLLEGSNELLERLLSLSCYKVIEIWQGHLNNYSGFKNELRILSRYFQ
jgi:sialic acid synthase SpsE